MKGAKLIAGTTTIVDCLGPLTFATVAKNHKKLGLSASRVNNDTKYWRAEARAGRIYAWVLANTRRLQVPVHFANPSGAVTFAILPARIGRRLR